ncbi:DUF5958 family protein [Streptomyces marianii]|uniref:Uncharacterized protein n=1 Tax=Streptomyces marianii TaxID=1817406 RepID=A0A5R9E2D7_9ACTN|nr:DUF5958 family protein [Streptomyces marianii]TLQ42173.1 hypothetical protein FEF34_02000 [Streptomyces marianii]
MDRTFLRRHCVQARAVAEDAPASIRRAGLRPTHWPAVLISRGRIDELMGKIAALEPLDERRRATGRVPPLDRGTAGRRAGPTSAPE